MPQDRAAWLLDRLQAEGARVTPRERLAVAEAIAALRPGDDELAAMVASLVAHTEEDWRWVHARGLALLPTWGAAPAPAPPDRLGWGLGLGFGVYVALMALGWAVNPEQAPDVAEVGVLVGPETPAGEVSPGEASPAEVSPIEAGLDEPPPEVLPPPTPTPADPPPLTLVTPARTSPATLPAETTTPPRADWVFSLSVALLALGLTLLIAPSTLVQRALERLRAARDKADDLYRQGAQGHVTLHIPKAECLGREAIFSAATSLGRQAVDRKSPHLDVLATVNHTAREAGRLIPHHLPALGGPPLLVWVDVERGDHPLLWAVERVLDRFTREGLPFVRLHYAYSPEQLTDPVTRRASPLADVARRHAGAPLLVFSRLSSPHGFVGDARWTRQLGPWPGRALVHVDLLRPAPGWLRRAGLVAFPFTDAGLQAAAALLASGERRGPRPAPPKLPSVGVGALNRWAVAAACVPNPTWPQLEALRLGIPSLRRELPDPRLVLRLVEHLRGPDGGEPCSDGGESLVLRRDDMAKRLADQRGPDGRPSALEEAALRLLIEQLREAPSDEESLAEWRRRVRVACYELTLRKRTVEEVLAEFADSPVRDELERRLAQEDRVRLEAGAGGGERLVEGLGVEGQLSFWEVGTAWARVSGVRRLGAAVALVVLAAAVWRLGAPGEVVTMTRRVELPEEWEVVPKEEPEPVVSVSVPPTPEPVPVVKPPKPPTPIAAAPTPAPPSEPTPTPTPEPTPTPTPEPTPTPTPEPTPAPTPRGPLRPALVSVRGGTFLMGSPEEALTWEGDRKAYNDELPQRELTIPAFQMCKTEVTQAQYEAVMGTNPSNCSWGCGDTLPVQTVSWFDAVAYLNRLTELESEARVAEGEASLSVCYAGSGADVRWARGCTGYRLPTEAEWEYAARAGTTTSWSFGEDPAVAGEYAWYHDNAVGKVHAVATKKANPWGLYDLHGNVWEWVWDGYDSYKSGKVVNSVGTDRALRGGAFNYGAPRLLRSALRDGDPPEYRNWYVGFRCARGPGPQR